MLIMSYDEKSDKIQELYDLVHYVIEGNSNPRKLLDIPEIIYDVDYVSLNDQLKLVWASTSNLMYIKNPNAITKKILY